MSLYRFARLSALLAFAGKYRSKIFHMAAAAAFALVTSWLYADIAAYLSAHHPGWTGFALGVKTLIVYAALFFLLWQLKPSDAEQPGKLDTHASARKARPKPETGSSGKTDTDDPGQPQLPPSRLEALADKPQLTSRKDAILNK
jgi:hypothetical protein